MSAVLVHLTVDCPCCEGNGELGREPMDWWHGSGVNVVTWPCPVCHGYGAASVEAVAEWRESLCDCGEPVADAMKDPARHRRCSLIGSRS